MKKFFQANVILLCLFVIVGIFPLSSSAAIATESSVQSKISKFKTLFPDESYFTTTGSNVCKTVTYDGYGASWCSGGTSCETCRLEYLFSDKCTNSSIKTAINQVPALKNMLKSRASCAGFATFAFCYIFEHDYQTNSTALSTANAGITDKFLSSLKPGDLVKCYNTMTSTNPSHWAIFLGYDQNYVYFYESNNLRPNRVEYNNKRPRNGLKLKSDGSWVKLVAFRSNTHTSKLTVNDTYKVTASDGFLSIRSTNSTSGTKLGTIPTGATFTVTKYDSDGNWGYVTYNGISGWSCLYDVKLVSSSSSSSSGTNETQPVNDVYCISAPDGFQAIRTQPTTSSTKIGEIPNGKYMTVTKYANDGNWDWGYTTYNGQSGWVCLYYTKLHNSHSYGSWTTVTSPTCTATGTQKRSCVCGATETQTTSALGHNYSSSWTTDVAATCTTAGSKSRHCTRCSAKTDVTAISETGHSYGTWTTTNSATCTATGSQKRTCSKCSTTETQTIPALGHNYSSTWTTDTAPTCTSAGSKSHHCTRCSAKTDVTAIAAKGHSYSAWTTIKAPTCTLAGEQKRTCSTCKTVETKGISALGHSYSSSWTTDTAPSCTTAGSKSHHCTKCSAKTDITAITATGHAWNEWKVTVNATEESTGTKTRTCKNSGCTVKETAVIAKLPSAGHTHSFGEWYTEKAATCTADGTLKRKCSGCDAFESKTISATGHSFGQWTTSKPATEKTEGILERKCANCNAKETESIPRLPQIVTEAPVTPTPIPAPTEAPTQNVGIPEVTAEPSVTSPILSDAPITTSEATTEATAVPTKLPTSNNPENNDDTDNDSTKIALIAVSSIAILLLVALVVIVLKKKS